MILQLLHESHDLTEFVKEIYHDYYGRYLLYTLDREMDDDDFRMILKNFYYLYKKGGLKRLC